MVISEIAALRMPTAITAMVRPFSMSGTAIIVEMAPVDFETIVRCTGFPDSTHALK
jgi:hypothetical protein